MRPIPGIVPATAPYWEAAQENRFVLPRCRECGRFHHHPRSWCPHCWSTDLDWEEASGRATVVTFSVVHQPPSPAFDVPYVLAVVELEEGPTMMTNIVDVAADEVRIGMEVVVTFEPRGDLALPQFRPAP
ncbi:MAG: Zn-ribbon domain-containing OB-fold protein [Acidimicrobiia bacterium]